MRNMKTALYCIVFGLMMAVLSCSAIKMGRSNISSQIPTMQKDQNLMQVPTMPLVIIPVSKTAHERPDFKPFRDSLINGMRNIKEAVERGNKKMDSSLYNQYLLLQGQADAYKALISQSNKIEQLQLDTARLYKTARLTTEVKQDAAFGNTTKDFFFYSLIFIAGGIVVIILMILYYHNELSRNIDKLINKDAA
jgi:hypothetical protein